MGIIDRIKVRHIVQELENQVAGNSAHVCVLLCPVGHHFANDQHFIRIKEYMYILI